MILWTELAAAAQGFQLEWDAFSAAALVISVLLVSVIAWTVLHPVPRRRLRRGLSRTRSAGEAMLRARVDSLTSQVDSLTRELNRLRQPPPAVGAVAPPRPIAAVEPAAPAARVEPTPAPAPRVEPPAPAPRRSLPPPPAIAPIPTAASASAAPAAAIVEAPAEPARARTSLPPIARIAPIPVQPSRAAPPLAAPPPPPQPARPAEPRALTAVVCDDDSVLAVIYDKMLRKQGFLVRRGGNGEEGLALIREMRPRLVLLDLDMPVKGGLQVLKDLRREGYEGSHIIVLSARENVAEQVIALGANDMMIKPFSPTDLNAKIQGLAVQWKEAGA